MFSNVAPTFVAAAILAFCVGVASLGVWSWRRLQKRVPMPYLHKSATRVDIWGAVLLVPLFLVGAIVRGLYPQTTVGAILNNPIGLAAASIVAIFGCSFLVAVFRAALRHRQP